MARIRSIKPEFWADEKMGPASDTVRLTFLALISMADDFGRLIDSEKQIEAFIWPYQNRAKDIRESLATLSRMGRIVRGKAANGQCVIEIVNWSKHQRVDHPNEKAALPQVVEQAPLPVIRESLANGSRHSRDALATDQYRDQDNDQDLKRVGARKTRAPSPDPEWVAEAVAIWTQSVGHTTPSRIRKALAPVVAAHEWERVAPALKVYVDPDEGPTGARKPEWFAENFHRWRTIAESPLDDGQGALTERGRRLMARGPA